MMASLTIIDVFQDLTFEKLRDLTTKEQALLLNYLLFWNWKGRKNNSITPRNRFLQNQMGVCENTYLDARAGLEDKGFITVDSNQGYDKKGKKKPAVVSLAAWLIKSNKITMNDQQASNQKTQSKEKQTRQDNKPVIVAKLDQFGKDLVTQIGATNSVVYPKQIRRIKNLESKTSKEVITLIRNYTNKHNNSNPLRYYETILENITDQGVKNITDLEQYNPNLVGKPRKPTQQQLPMMSVVKDQKKKNTYKTRYIRGKRVERGTDWKLKEVEEKKKNIRTWLGLHDGDPLPVEYQRLSVEEAYKKAYSETNQGEKLKELKQMWQEL